MNDIRRRVIKQLTEDGKTDAEGVSLTLHYGEEVFSPVQYNSFRIGGHSVTLVPKPGETLKDLYRRGNLLLEEVAEKEFDHRLETFRQRIARTRV